MRAIALAASVATGCALFGIGAEAQFRKEALPRAATEIGCDERKITVNDLGDKRIAIEGCGRTAQYQYLEPGGWIRDTGATYDTMPGRPKPAALPASASASASPSSSPSSAPSP